MLTFKKLSLIALIAVGAAAPSRAFADHRRPGGAWRQLGVVGTHSHDAEDYVPVAPGIRLERLALRALDGAVALDGVQIQFTDGRSQFVGVRRRLFPGQEVIVDVPGYNPSSVQMLVLNYGNAGPYWRARETAHVQVLALNASGRDRGYDRYRDRSYDRDRDYDRDRGYDRDRVYDRNR